MQVREPFSQEDVSHPAWRAFLEFTDDAAIERSTEEQYQRWTWFRRGWWAKSRQVPHLGD